jgi:uncharacterized protein (DUF488 family)
VTETATIDAPKVTTIFTIGFTGKSAEQFFEKLRSADVRCLVDIRLNNVSQLAGFTKKRDLEYFLRAVAGIDYRHELQLAPTKDILEAYKKKQIGWDDYERRFFQLMEERRPDRLLHSEDLGHACLLCSEPTPEHCHRRLVIEFLQSHWANVEVQHL